MIKLDENLLVELGLAALPKDEKTSFLKHMYETLEMRVGTRLAERMSDQQMSEFEQFINSNDEQGAFHWLEGNFPNYKEVVAEEFEKLKNEIKPMAADILAANQVSPEAAAVYTQTPQAQALQTSQAPQPPALYSEGGSQPLQNQPQDQLQNQQPQATLQSQPQDQYQQNQQVQNQPYQDPPQPSQTPPQQQPQAPGHHPQYPPQ